MSKPMSTGRSSNLCAGDNQADKYVFCIHNVCVMKQTIVCTGTSIFLALCTVCCSFIMY